MATITVRNLDDAVYEALRKRARANGRSMESEVRAIIEAAVAPKAASLVTSNGQVRPCRSLSEVLEKYPPIEGIPGSSLDLLSELRAERF